MDLTVPLLTAFTFCRLGYQVVRVLLLAWLTLLPVLGPLPQISHFLDMGLTSRANLTNPFIKKSLLMQVKSHSHENPESAYIVAYVVSATCSGAIY